MAFERNIWNLFWSDADAYRGISTCDAAGVLLARPTWLRNVKSNHYGRCYPIRVNIRNGIVPVLIRS